VKKNSGKSKYKFKMNEEKLDQKISRALSMIKNKSCDSPEELALFNSAYQSAIRKLLVPARQLKDGINILKRKLRENEVYNNLMECRGMRYDKRLNEWVSDEKSQSKAARGASSGGTSSGGASSGGAAKKAKKKSRKAAAYDRAANKYNKAGRYAGGRSDEAVRLWQERLAERERQARLAAIYKKSRYG
jgi:hypothetical protein